MFNVKLGNEKIYDISLPEFRTAMDFLSRPGLAELPEGWIELACGVRASVQHYTTKPAAELSFESHEKYYDVQYLVEGEELIGVISRSGLIQKTGYNAGEDITFYEEPEVSGGVLLRKGEYVILAPEDAHKPRCSAGKPEAVIKIVVKVPVRA